MEQFVNNLEDLSARVEKLKDSVNTEEATKTALILPFFQTLGYDVFNPLEFTPEFIADVGIKKGEKVDYAIIEDNEPTILIECKSVNEKLTNHDSQLFRYYGTSSSRFGILTNGIEYRFFTDLEEKNKMDSKPFLIFNILHMRENHVKELFKFTKENFNVDNISSSAYELKYINLIKNYFNEQLKNPNEEFIKHVLNSVYDGVKTKAVIEKFTPLIHDTLNLIIKEKVTDKLNAALNNNGDSSKLKLQIPDNVTEEKVEKDEKEEKQQKVVHTTPEELETYAIIKVILSDVIEPDRIFYRDNQSYFNITVDDNIRKWIVRAFLDTSNKKIIINDEEKTTISLEKPIDLMNSKEVLHKAVQKFI